MHFIEHINRDVSPFLKERSTMRIKDMLAYSKEKFHNELDKYIRLVENTKSNELSQLLTFIILKMVII